MNEVRICDICEHHNPLGGQMFCVNCQEDISHIPPTPISDSDYVFEEEFETEETATKTVRMDTLSLLETESGFEIQIPVNGGIIGRQGTINREYFQGHTYVSNRHASILLKTTNYVVVDLGSTNGTKINGTLLIAGVEHPLAHGDTLTIANLTFKVE